MEFPEQSMFNNRGVGVQEAVVAAGLGIAAQVEEETVVEASDGLPREWKGYSSLMES